MRLVSLTTEIGPILVNPEKVVTISAYSSGATLIRFAGLPDYHPVITMPVGKVAELLQKA